MEKRIFAIVLISAFVFAGVAHAHTVTMNLAFHIGSDKDNLIHVDGNDFNGTQFLVEHYDTLEKPYMSSEKDGIVAAVISSGRFVNGVLQTSYSADDYLFQMTQDNNENMFIIAFTKGSWQNIETHVGSEKMPSLTYGYFSPKAPGSYMFFSRLGFESIDIIGDATVSGEKTIFVRNMGSSGLKDRVEIGVIG